MRNTIEVQVWMKRNGISVVSIQRDLNFENHGTVSNALAGRNNNRRVLQYLLEKGCPKKILGLPSGRQKKS